MNRNATVRAADAERYEALYREMDDGELASELFLGLSGRMVTVHDFAVYEAAKRLQERAREDAAV